MTRIPSRRRFRGFGPLIASLAHLVACGGTEDARTTVACSGAECEADAGGSPHASLLDCAELCREVAACGGEVDVSCRRRCEDTLDMAVSLGCGPEYAGYVHCVLEAADACVREQPAECAGAYATLDSCLCAAVPEDCR